MNVLVLAALTEATGNAVTSRRIASHLATKHNVTLVDAVETTVPELRAIARDAKIDAAVGVHALLAGPFLRPLGVPYALIFGGTDLYEQTHELHYTQMSRAVAGAARLIAFSPENRARAEWMWPTIAGRVELLPQGVDVPPPSPDFSIRRLLGLGASDVLALLPTGIRRVKDPLHVVDAVSVWHVVHPRVHLVLAGALLEQDYAEEALEILSERAGVHYLSALPRDRMLAGIREADVVLNTSLSEGMCGVLLEAMALRTPIVARRNAGNESLVTHGHTGLLYDSPAELVHWINALVASPELRERISTRAHIKVESEHSMDHECGAYLDVVDDLAGFGRPSLLPPPTAPVDELDLVATVAERVGLNTAHREGLVSLVEKLRDEPNLERTRRNLSGLLGTAPPSVAISEIRRAGLERSMDRERARLFYLLLGLLQVPAAEARHAARGIDAAITRETLGDLALWSHQLQAQTGALGVSLEMLAWSQRYLRGELLQFGKIQFDLRPFSGPLRVYRNVATRGLSAVSLDGRVIDLETGTIGDGRAPSYDPSEWRLTIEPGSPMLEMWIPTNSLVSLADVARSVKQAYATFAKLAPETIPVGICGETWRLDPQILPFVSPDLGFHALQRVTCKYPSALPEAKTIRRLFGPSVDRAGLSSMAEASLDPVQRAVVQLLSSRDRSLRARCGFMLREEIEAAPEWT